MTVHTVTVRAVEHITANLNNIAARAPWIEAACINRLGWPRSYAIGWSVDVQRPDGLERLPWQTGHPPPRGTVSVTCRATTGATTGATP